MGLFDKKNKIKKPLSIFNKCLNREDFIKNNINVIVSNLLYDAIYNTINTDSTTVKLFPNFVKKAGETKAYSLFEVCRQALIRGKIEYIYLDTQKAFVFDSIGVLTKDYKNTFTIYEAGSPYGYENNPMPIEDVLAIPLEILYEVYKSIFVKKTLFSNKIVVFLDTMREKMNSDNPAIIKANQEKIENQIELIIENATNVWALDGKDRVGSFPLVDEENKEVIMFAYIEIARILGVPLTRLLGKSPDGQNATGEADANNYVMTLYKISNGLIFPVLKSADTNAQLKKTYKLEDFRSLMQVVNAVESVDSIPDTQKNIIISNVLESLGIKINGK